MSTPGRGVFFHGTGPSMGNRTPRSVAAACALAASAFVANVGYAQTITECGQRVSGSATLGADLDCTGFAEGVIVEKGNLALAGHTISNASNAGVLCENACKIFGPGALSGNAIGIYGYASTKIDGVTVELNTGVGVYVFSPVQSFPRSNYKPVKVTNSTIADNGSHGIEVGGTAKVFDSQVVRNGGNGVHALSPPNGATKIKRSNISENVEDGVETGGGIRASDSSFNDNGIFGVIMGRDARGKARNVEASRNGSAGLIEIGTLKNVVANDNGVDGVSRIKSARGLEVRRNGRIGLRAFAGSEILKFIKIVDLVATDNGRFGLWTNFAGEMKISDSTLQQNGFGPDCATLPCGDILIGSAGIDALSDCSQAESNPPRLRNVVCDRSGPCDDGGSTGNHGFCSLD